MKQILEIIHKYKKNNANIVLFKNVCKGLILFFLVYFFNIIIERFYYFDPSIKIKLIKFYFASLFFYIFYISLQWIITINSFFNYKNNFDIAKEIGAQNKNIKDRLLNVLQINNQINVESDDLKKHATNKLKIKLQKFLNNSTNFRYPKSNFIIIYK